MSAPPTKRRPAANRAAKEATRTTTTPTTTLADLADKHAEQRRERLRRDLHRIAARDRSVAAVARRLAETGWSA